MSHLQCRKYLFNIVFTHPKKSDAFSCFEKGVNIIKNQYQGNIRFIRLDGETSFGSNFENFVSKQGIKSERTAPDTPAQNGGSKRAGRVIITKSRSLCNETGLPPELWPEFVKAAGYISNRTPIRKLEWKTPHELVTKNAVKYAHMHIYGCKAYALNHHIPRRDKMEPRAHIGYLVGYDSTNIYRIWIPSRERVI